MYRPVIGGVDFALRDNIECGETEAEKLKIQLAFVCGAAFSDRWMQIIADIAGY